MLTQAGPEPIRKGGRVMTEKTKDVTSTNPKARRVAIKKLTVKRETLKDLDPQESAQVRGGNTLYLCQKASGHGC